MSDANQTADPHMTTAPAGDPPPATGMDVPGFALGDEVGRGGMGIVYRARDLALDREVAVKLLQDKYAAASSAAARFVEEARITAQLQHPGIPAVYHVGKLSDGRPFLAMKLIKGDTLSDDRPAAGTALGVFEAVCQAVGYAHSRGVIHRDLKPQNVMVGAFGEVQVMDWGLAKLLASRERERPEGDPEATVATGTEIRSLRDSDGSFTQAGSVLGTPAFMPPEQAAGELDKIDRRSDVFALGAVLCWLLTGKPPYTGADADSVRVVAVRGNTADAVARLDTCRADPGLVALCKQCLAFEPADRPADAGVLATEVAALRTAAEDRARRAETTAATERVRRRLTVRLGGLVVAVLLAGVAGTTVGLVRADAARRAAEAAEQAEAGERKRAEGARVQAETKEAEAEAVVKFVQKQVFGVDLGEKQDRPGSDLKLTEVVKAALPALSVQFQNQPLVEARLRSTVGTSYLGVDDKVAREQFERVRAIFDEQRCPAHADMLSAMSHLADIYAKEGRVAEALKVREDVLAAHRQLSNANQRNLQFYIAGLETLTLLAGVVSAG